MQIQVNGDHNIAIHEELERTVESEVDHVLGRFADRITRIEVHLSDVNGNKPGIQDKHCLMEARPAGHAPVVATDKAATLEEALRGAAHKLYRHLETLFGRLDRSNSIHER